MKDELLGQGDHMRKVVDVPPSWKDKRKASRRAIVPRREVLTASIGEALLERNTPSRKERQNGKDDKRAGG